MNFEDWKDKIIEAIDKIMGFHGCENLRNYELHHGFVQMPFTFEVSKNIPVDIQPYTIISAIIMFKNGETKIFSMGELLPGFQKEFYEEAAKPLRELIFTKRY